LLSVAFSCGKRWEVWKGNATQSADPPRVAANCTRFEGRARQESNLQPSGSKPDAPFEIRIDGEGDDSIASPSVVPCVVLAERNAPTERDSASSPNPAELDRRTDPSLPVEPEADPELAAVCRAWASLPDPIRSAVLLLVKSAAK